MAVAESRSDHVDLMVSLLADGGEYLGLERAPHAVQLATWLGVLHNSGLQIDAAHLGFLHVAIPGNPERIPAVRALRNAATSDAGLVALVHKALPKDFTEEDALAADPPQERLWGREFHIQDEMGSGITRVEVLRLTSGLIVYYESTSRGYRDLWSGDRPEEVFEAAEHFRAMAEKSATIVKTVDVTAGPGGVAVDVEGVIPRGESGGAENPSNQTTAGGAS